MIQYNMYEAKTNLSKICKALENKEEDLVLISRNGKPIIQLTLFNNKDRSKFFGCAKGQFSIPDNFDEIEISQDFEEDIL